MNERGAAAPEIGGVPLLRRTAAEIVVVKPPGLSCERPGDGDSLLARLHPALPGCDLRLPHRLDRMARGIVVVALSVDAVARHNERIRAGRWEKHYLARAPAGVSLVGEHRAFLRRSGTRSEVVRSGGKPSRLEVLAEAPAPEAPGERHLLIRLHSGRFHQIRAMLAHLGSPLSGDALYGGRPGTEPYLEHALLVMVDLETERPVTLWRRRERLREATAPELLDRLDAIAARSAPDSG